MALVGHPCRSWPRWALLNPRRFRTDEAGWWDTERIAADYLWGGEIGASRLVGIIKPATQTLYVRPGHNTESAVKRLVRTYRMRSDSAGPIEIVEPFWAFDDQFAKAGLVPPFLIYADLLALLDARATEAATEIKLKYLNGDVAGSPRSSN